MLALLWAFLLLPIWQSPGPSFLLSGHSEVRLKPFCILLTAAPSPHHAGARQPAGSPSRAEADSRIPLLAEFCPEQYCTVGK